MNWKSNWRCIHNSAASNRSNKESKASIVGPFEDFEKLFAKAGAFLEKEIFKHIKQSAIGDDFDYVAKSTKIKSWQELGLKLPERPQTASTDFDENLKMPQTWKIAKQKKDDPPRLQFRFPAPLSSYSGEATALTGNLKLTEKLSLSGSTGWIEVDTKSVTLGEDSLDNSVKDSMIYVDKFPTSRFKPEIDERRGQTAKLRQPGVADCQR